MGIKSKVYEVKVKSFDHFYFLEETLVLTKEKTWRTGCLGEPFFLARVGFQPGPLDEF